MIKIQFGSNGLTEKEIEKIAEMIIDKGSFRYKVERFVEGYVNEVLSGGWNPEKDLHQKMRDYPDKRRFLG